VEKLRNAAAIAGSWLLALVIVAVVLGVNIVLLIAHPFW
jgi:hypothetical protein